jgi:hypothetical protein
MVSIYRPGMNDHLVSTRRLTKQFPTSFPDVTSTCITPPMRCHSSSRLANCGIDKLNGDGGTMPRGPKGEKRPADVIAAAVMVGRIATGK